MPRGLTHIEPSQQVCRAFPRAVPLKSQLSAGSGTLGLWLVFSEIAIGALCSIALLMISTADIYRKIAAALRDRASYEKEPNLAVRWKELADSYFRLATEAEDGGSAHAAPGQRDAPPAKDDASDLLP